MRIGEIAERVGVTQRTIRYYEERGLLGHGGDGRAKGTHRLYTEADVVRLQELLRLRDLLGLTLEDLAELAEAEEARAALRGEWEESTSDAQRARIVEASIPLVERQLDLVRSRQEKLVAFADELETKLARLQQRRDELSAGSGTRARRAPRTSP
jgi:DNA-binding transcriptional MerR regulator